MGFAGSLDIADIPYSRFAHYFITGGLEAQAFTYTGSMCWY